MYNSNMTIEDRIRMARDDEDNPFLNYDILDIVEETTGFSVIKYDENGNPYYVQSDLCGYEDCLISTDGQGGQGD